MADTYGYGCPYPDCNWSMQIDPGMSLDNINQILFIHCNTRHPGWTMAELKQHHEARQQELKIRAFLEVRRN